MPTRRHSSPPCAARCDAYTPSSIAPPPWAPPPLPPPAPAAAADPDAKAKADTLACYAELARLQGRSFELNERATFVGSAHSDVVKYGHITTVPSVKDVLQSRRRRRGQHAAAPSGWTFRLRLRRYLERARCLLARAALASHTLCA